MMGMVSLDWLHDYIIFFLIFILMGVLGVILSLSLSNYISMYVLEIPVLELVWTIIPVIILLFLAIPSLMILYEGEDSSSNDFTLKVSGHQWYWSYDYSDFSDVEFDSYLTSDYNLGEFRLLMTDNHLVFPSGSSVKFLVSSADVLHSWTIPSLGVKMDANPARMNIMHSYLYHMGYYFGQCSEICGANHSFMPITLEVVSYNLFKNWIKSF